jgi:hypothetical protein
MTLTFNDLSRFYSRLNADERPSAAELEAAPVLDAIAAIAPHHPDDVITISGRKIPTDRGRNVIEEAIGGRFSADAMIAARYVLRCGRAPVHVWEATELVEVQSC